VGDGASCQGVSSAAGGGMNAVRTEPTDVIAQALASLDGAAASLALNDCEAAMDDVLAARLMLQALLFSLDEGRA